jgi:anti-sigma B factor antagonist
MNTKAGLAITGEGDVAIAAFTSSCICDVEEITNAAAQVRQYIETHQLRRMVFDFSGVRFFSSQVLGLLLEARAGLAPQNGEVAITALSPQLERVFRITNLDKIFSFYPDKAAAVGSAPGNSRES